MKNVTPISNIKKKVDKTSGASGSSGTKALYTGMDAAKVGNKVAKGKKSRSK